MVLCSIWLLILYNLLKTPQIDNISIFGELLPQILLLHTLVVISSEWCTAFSSSSFFSPENRPYCLCVYA